MYKLTLTEKAIYKTIEFFGREKCLKYLGDPIWLHVIVYKATEDGDVFYNQLLLGKNYYAKAVAEINNTVDVNEVLTRLLTSYKFHDLLYDKSFIGFDRKSMIYRGIFSEINTILNKYDRLREEQDSH